MENNNPKHTNKEDFIMPKVEIIVFNTDDVITTSGGGFRADEWDE